MTTEIKCHLYIIIFKGNCLTTNTATQLCIIWQLGITQIHSYGYSVIFFVYVYLELHISISIQAFLDD